GFLRPPIDGILPLLLGRGGKIRNVAAFDDALPRRHGADRAELIERSRRRGVILEIPVRGVRGLPDAVHVGFAVPLVTRGAAGPAFRGRLRTPGGRLSSRAATGR